MKMPKEEKKKIGIVLVLYKIKESFLCNFMKLNSEIINNYIDQIFVITDKNIKINNEKVKLLVYPIEMKQLNFSKLLNYGIKRCNCDLIIKTDVDIVFSKEVIKSIIDTVVDGKGITYCCSNINDIRIIDNVSWESMKKRKGGYGACFAMTKVDWFRLKGYNENLIGLGGEDTDLFERASHLITIIKTSKYPLYHLKHESRITTGEGSFWEKRSVKNIKIARDNLWDNNQWGEGVGRQ